VSTPHSESTTLQDLLPEYRPDREALVGGLGPQNVASIHALLATSHFYSYANLLGWLSPEFMDTLLGEDQAPEGQWGPELAEKGMLPNLTDVLSALDASVTKQYVDL